MLYAWDAGERWKRRAERGVDSCERSSRETSRLSVTTRRTCFRLVAHVLQCQSQKTTFFWPLWNGWWVHVPFFHLVILTKQWPMNTTYHHCWWWIVQVIAVANTSSHGCFDDTTVCVQVFYTDINWHLYTCILPQFSCYGHVESAFAKTLWQFSSVFDHCTRTPH